MAADARRNDELIAELISHSQDFDYFQLVRILESVWNDAIGRGARLSQKVRFRPASEISFPPADIRRVRRDASERLDVQLNFMGLYGVDAAVPHYFIESVLRTDEAGETTRAFLDIWGDRFYVLLYLVWEKYRFIANLENGRSKLLGYLAALCGRHGVPLAPETLAYAGLLGSRVRTKSGLEGLLAEVTGAAVFVEQWVAQWIKADAAAAVGTTGATALRLGQNTMLGEYVLDRGRKVKVHVGPVSLDKAQSLLPGTEAAKLLAMATAEYLGRTVSFDVELVVEGAQGMAPALGDTGLRLGWWSWLGQASGEACRLYVPGGEYTRHIAAAPAGSDAPTGKRARAAKASVRSAA